MSDMPNEIWCTRSTDEEWGRWWASNEIGVRFVRADADQAERKALADRLDTCLDVIAFLNDGEPARIELRNGFPSELQKALENLLAFLRRDLS